VALRSLRGGLLRTVKLLCLLCSVMGKEDMDAAAALISQMKSEGVEFHDHCSIDEVMHCKSTGFMLKYTLKQASGEAKGGVLEVDAVLVAAGDLLVSAH
jgi:pyruvate/2-oxoglutarate dehydrogenase complex dihydrolipoamide dehydrogenase (E3) component